MSESFSLVWTVDVCVCVCVCVCVFEDGAGEKKAVLHAPSHSMTKDRVDWCSGTDPIGGKVSVCSDVFLLVVCLSALCPLLT